MPGAGLITWGMDYRIDRARKDVNVTLFGGGQSHAVFREGLGCYLSHGDEAVDASLPSAASEMRRALLPEIAGASLVETANPELKRALDGAFVEPDRVHKTVYTDPQIFDVEMEKIWHEHTGRVLAHLACPTDHLVLRQHV